MYKAGAESLKIFSGGRGIKLLMGVEKSYCQTRGLVACPASRPCCILRDEVR